MILYEYFCLECNKRFYLRSRQYDNERCCPICKKDNKTYLGNFTTRKM